MDPVTPLFTSLINLISALLKLAGDFFRPRPKPILPGHIASLSHCSEVVFDWMNLSKAARKKLGRSKFIRISGTRAELMDLIESATEKDSTLAICGYKGDFSAEYYNKNFEKCKAVMRVFSYEAVRSEIENKNEPYALNGLKLHLSKEAKAQCDVTVFLIPKGTRIKGLGGGNFDPPLSFGLAILLDSNNSPKMAIVHWEMDAEPLKHLIAVEGFIIDGRQKELLNELMMLHKSIVGSDKVLSSKREEDLKTITAICTELEEFWELRQNDKALGVAPSSIRLSSAQAISKPSHRRSSAALHQRRP